MINVYGLFKPSLALELGINALEKEGFEKSKLQLVTLEPGQPGKQRLLDTTYASDGMSLMDGVAISASLGMVLGAIYGSVVFIGPVALGLVGMAGGGGLGFLLDRWKQRKNGPKYTVPTGDIIVVVRCGNEELAARAEDIMREYSSTALGRA